MGCGRFERKVSNLREITSCPVLRYMGQWLRICEDEDIPRPDTRDRTRTRKLMPCPGCNDNIRSLKAEKWTQRTACSMLRQKGVYCPPEIAFHAPLAKDRS